LDENLKFHTKGPRYILHVRFSLPEQGARPNRM
jgi:hypothetical protein